MMLMTATATATQAPTPTRPQTHWMREGKYGIFCHYLPKGDTHQQTVNSFDVKAFADGAAEAGAAYVVFTLGQNSGYYCAPNATYEKLAGYAPHERCAKRDLPMELADALAKRGIRFMLYLPSRSPQQDQKAMKNLGDVSEGEPAPQEFTRNWSAVIREWSERYGKRVSGWWFDGAYNRAGWDDARKRYNWTTWAAACRAGNPDSILAFNPGLNPKQAFGILCDEQDYTAGEANEWGATPKGYPAPDGVQWQILSFLGTQWGRPDGPRDTDEKMIAYTRQVIEQGGAITFDLNVSGDGHLYTPALKQLIAIRKAIRGK